MCGTLARAKVSSEADFNREFENSEEDFNAMGRTEEMLGRRKRTLVARLSAWAIAAASLAIGACTTDIAPPAVNQVNLQPNQDSAEVGGTISSFSAAAFDVQGKIISNRPITWHIADTSIATVDATGKVTTKALGSTRLTAIVGGRPSNQAFVVVISKVAKLIVAPDSVDVNMGATRQLAAAVFDERGSAIPGRTINWSSQNPTIAAVSTAGLVTPISIGETTVTATVGDFSKVIKVNVIPERVSATRITDPVTGSYILRLTKSLQVTAVALNSQGQALTGRSFRWTSSNPAVASVTPDGLVTGMAIGNATVTVECEGTVDQLSVQVTQIPVASVAISPASLTLLTGTNTQLVAVVKDSAGNALSTLGRNVIWTSSNLTVASVTGNGVLSAIAAGTSDVQLLVDQVPSQVLTVTVTQKPVVSVTVTPQAQQLKVGFSVQLQATLRDIDGNVLANRPVNWTTSDGTLATVSANGQVQAVAVGTVTITATSEGVNGTAVITVIP